MFRHLVDRIVRQGHPHAIDAVIVGKRVVFQNGRIQIVDESALLSDAPASAERVDTYALRERR